MESRARREIQNMQIITGLGDLSNRPLEKSLFHREAQLSRTYSSMGAHECVWTRQCVDSQWITDIISGEGLEFF